MKKVDVRNWGVNNRTSNVSAMIGWGSALAPAAWHLCEAPATTSPVLGEIAAEIHSVHWVFLVQRFDLLSRRNRIKLLQILWYQEEFRFLI